MTARGLRPAILLLTAPLLGPIALPAQTEAPVTVFVVRHAEKADASTDPSLSTGGQERAKELGGTVLQPPTDKPWGRVSVLRDSQGAVFSVIAPVQPS